MQITFGGDGSAIAPAFLDFETGQFTVELVSATATRTELRNPATGFTTVVTGTGFSSDPLSNPTGTVTGMVIRNAAGTLMAEYADFAWPTDAFQDAHFRIIGSGDATGLIALFNLQDVSIDASSRTGQIRPLGAFAREITSDLSIIGSRFGDVIDTGAGNDTVRPGGSGWGEADFIFGSLGSDRFDFQDIATGNGIVELVYDHMPGHIVVDIDGPANVGSVAKSTGSHLDTLVSLDRALRLGDGFAIVGTNDRDSFRVETRAGDYVAIEGMGGGDVYEIGLGGVVRLIFANGGTEGIHVDLGLGRIFGDGFGFQEDLIVFPSGGTLEIDATAFADFLVGSVRDDVFFPRGGDDTIWGGAGTDIVGYNRVEMSQPVTVDLLAGEVTGAWAGSGFSQGVADIEDVVGTWLAAGDTLRGSDGANWMNGGAGNDVVEGRGGDDILLGWTGDDVLRGGTGHDLLNGGEGRDTLNGEDGDDLIFGGSSPADLCDVIYGGAGNDRIEAGYGNDQVYGGDGDDTVEGGFGVDEIIGQTGNDVLTGSALSDLIFGGDGDDFINGGFGSDRVNGGAGADRFYHLGIADHGSDWIQDFSAADGDRLVWGGGAATRAQFQVNLTETANAGQAGVDEAFVIWRPTGQILWALVDGGAQGAISIQIGGQVFDLLA